MKSDLTLVELLSQIETLLARHPEFSSCKVLTSDKNHEVHSVLRFEGQTLRLGAQHHA